MDYSQINLQQVFDIGDGLVAVHEAALIAVAQQPIEASANLAELRQKLETIENQIKYHQGEIQYLQAGKQSLIDFVSSRAFPP